MGLGDDLPELWLECFSRRSVATYRRDVPAQEMSAMFRQAHDGANELSAVSGIASEGAFAHEYPAGTVGRLHL